jgi:hypothetical protein
VNGIASVLPCTADISIEPISRRVASHVVANEKDPPSLPNKDER